MERRRLRAVVAGKSGKRMGRRCEYPGQHPRFDRHRNQPFRRTCFNVSDTIGTIPCNTVLFVSMKTRASTSLSAELKDRTKVKPLNFTIFNPAGANANGNAFGAS